MSRRNLLCLSAVLVMLSWMSAAQSVVRSRGPEVLQELYHDTSAPVWLYPSGSPLAVTGHRIHPLRTRPLAGPPALQDDAEQTYDLLPVAATLGVNKDGIPDSANGSLLGIPSDSNLAVGATQVVETINTAYAVYSKNGAVLQAPKQISGIFTGVSGLCGQGVTSFNFSDPVVLYDQMAGRWIITILAFNNAATTGNECIAVSTSSDARGTYHRYAFGFGSGNFNDYPKFGVWPDAYYAAYNIFTVSTAFAKACAYNRAAMLAGTTAKAICFNNSAEFSFLPSNLEGSTLPPSGEPDFFVDLFSTSSLHLFRFHVDFVTPSNSTFKGVSVTVSAFTPACNGGTCIPQGGTNIKLDSLADRLMFPLHYRNFGSHESLVVSHAVKTSKAPAGERWYEIRNPNGTPAVFQQATFTNGGLSLWMGSIAMDMLGDMALGYSQSSGTTHPGVAFTGRVPGDPLGTMESPVTIFTGGGSQTGNGNTRWGDYSSMVIDPVDNCTFWYVNQYIPSNGAFNFHTRLASMKFPSCP